MVQIYNNTDNMNLLFFTTKLINTFQMSLRFLISFILLLKQIYNF